MTNSPEPSRPSDGPSSKSSAEAARQAAPEPMRSFRLYVRRPLFGADRREAADYPPEEAAAVERVFAAQVRARRRRGRVTVIFLAGTAVAMLVPSDGFRALAVIFGGACVLVLFISMPALYCPGCTRGVEFGRGDHCPGCGARGTLAPLPPGGEQCRACGCVIRYGHKGRRLFLVKHCTHCGLRLDPEGV